MNLVEFSALLATLTYLFLGLFVYSRNRRNKLNLSFFLYFLSLFLWSFGIFGLVFFKNLKTALVWIRILNLGLVFLPSNYLYFLFSYLTPKFIRKKYLIIVYVYSFISLILSFTELFTKGLTQTPFGFIAVPGPIFPAFTLIFLSIVFYGNYILFIKYKEVKGFQANQIRYLFLGTLIMILGEMFVLPSIFGKVILGGFPIWNFTSIAYGGILTYAIFRHHLMGINIVTKKTAIYSIVIALVAGGYFSIISLFDYLFVAFIGHPSTISRVIAVIIIAAIFHPLRNKIEAIIDKIFFRTKYDYQQTLLTFSQNLTGFLDLRELLTLLSEVISRTMHVTSVSILLWQKESNSYTMSSFVGLPEQCRHWQFPKESQLISWLSQEKGIAVRALFSQKPLPPMYRRIIAEMKLLKAAVSMPLIYKGDLVAVINIGSKQSGEIYMRSDIELLNTISNEAAVAISNAHLYNDLQKSYLQTIQALAQAIEANDEYTRGHSDRVTILAMEIAREMKIPREEMEKLRYACILHDVGKIAILKEILNKPGKLSDSEFAVIKLHPVKGDEIIAPVGFLEDIRPAVRHHHERFDGKGYPDGLENGNIPLLARIIAVADTYDAMTSHRPYRPAMSPDTAAAELKRCSGTQFDPAVVDAFLTMYTKSPNETR